MSKNHITTLKFLSPFLSLETLDLSQNDVSALPSLNPLLRVVNLSHNRISAVRGFDALTSLVELNLSYNNLQRMTGLSRCVHLQVLNLSHNRLSRVEGLERLTRLTRVNLCDNLIGTIEDIQSLALNRKIEELEVRGNEVCGTPSLRTKVFQFLPLLKVLNGYERSESENEDDADRTYSEIAADDIHDKKEVDAGTHQCRTRGGSTSTRKKRLPGKTRSKVPAPSAKGGAGPSTYASSPGRDAHTRTVVTRHNSTSRSGNDGQSKGSRKEQKKSGGGFADTSSSSSFVDHSLRTSPDELDQLDLMIQQEKTAVLSSTPLTTSRSLGGQRGRPPTGHTYSTSSGSLRHANDSMQSLPSAAQLDHPHLSDDDDSASGNGDDSRHQTSHYASYAGQPHSSRENPEFKGASPSTSGPSFMHRAPENLPHLRVPSPCGNSASNETSSEVSSRLLRCWMSLAVHLNEMDDSQFVETALRTIGCLFPSTGSECSLRASLFLPVSRETSHTGAGGSPHPSQHHHSPAQSHISPPQTSRSSSSSYLPWDHVRRVSIERSDENPSELILTESTMTLDGQGDGIAGHVLLTGAKVMCADAEDHMLFSPEVDCDGLLEAPRSSEQSRAYRLACWPIIRPANNVLKGSGPRIIGVLQVFGPCPELTHGMSPMRSLVGRAPLSPSNSLSSGFTVDDVQLIDGFCQQLAIGLASCLQSRVTAVALATAVQSLQTLEAKIARVQGIVPNELVHQLDTVSKEKERLEADNSKLALECSRAVHMLRSLEQRYHHEASNSTHLRKLFAVSKVFTVLLPYTQRLRREALQKWRESCGSGDAVSRMEVIVAKLSETKRVSRCFSKWKNAVQSKKIESLEVEKGVLVQLSVEATEKTQVLQRQISELRRGSKTAIDSVVVEMKNKDERDSARQKRLAKLKSQVSVLTRKVETLEDQLADRTKRFAVSVIFSKLRSLRSTRLRRVFSKWRIESKSLAGFNALNQSIHQELSHTEQLVSRAKFDLGVADEKPALRVDVAGSETSADYRNQHSGGQGGRPDRGARLEPELYSPTETYSVSSAHEQNVCGEPRGNDPVPSGGDHYQHAESNGHYHDSSDSSGVQAGGEVDVNVNGGEVPAQDNVDRLAPRNGSNMYTLRVSPVTSDGRSVSTITNGPISPRSVAPPGSEKVPESPSPSRPASPPTLYPFDIEPTESRPEHIDEEELMERLADMEESDVMSASTDTVPPGSPRSAVSEFPPPSCPVSPRAKSKEDEMEEQETRQKKGLPNAYIMSIQGGPDADDISATSVITNRDDRGRDDVSEITRVPLSVHSGEPSPIFRESAEPPPMQPEFLQLIGAQEVDDSHASVQDIPAISPRSHVSYSEITMDPVSPRQETVSKQIKFFPRNENEADIQDQPELSNYTNPPQSARSIISDVNSTTPNSPAPSRPMSPRGGRKHSKSSSSFTADQNVVDTSFASVSTNPPMSPRSLMSLPVLSQVPLSPRVGEESLDRDHFVVAGQPAPYAWSFQGGPYVKDASGTSVFTNPALSVRSDNMAASNPSEPVSPTSRDVTEKKSVSFGEISIHESPYDDDSSIEEYSDDFGMSDGDLSDSPRGNLSDVARRPPAPVSGLVLNGTGVVGDSSPTGVVAEESFDSGRHPQALPRKNRVSATYTHAPDVSLDGSNDAVHDTVDDGFDFEDFKSENSDTH